MVAHITAFDTRADVGLRAPKRRSTNITPSRGGAVVHHGASQTPTSHSACQATWRQYQRMHMDTNGWVDVAYTGAFCNHGVAMAGRGFGVRTGANGTNVGNQNNYAFVFIGDGKDANDLAVAALEWWINEARTKGGAGDDVRPHRYFTGSTCPSNKLLALTPRWHRQRIVTTGSAPAEPVPTPLPEKDWFDMATKADLVEVVNDALDAHRQAGHFLGMTPGEAAQQNLIERTVLGTHKHAETLVRDVTFEKGLTRRILRNLEQQGGRNGDRLIGLASQTVTVAEIERAVDGLDIPEATVDEIAKRLAAAVTVVVQPVTEQGPSTPAQERAALDVVEA